MTSSQVGAQPESLTSPQAASSAIHVVGMGLEGAAGLPPAQLALIGQAHLLVGSARHLGAFSTTAAEVWPITDFQATVDQLRQRLAANTPGLIVVLASGDPLFFGLGRLLLTALPPEHITFHPHVSSMQLAFSRLKMPWQNATLVSAHGRSTEALMAVLKRGDPLVAVLTDNTHTPNALARLLLDLELASRYRLWVCENLGGSDEQIHALTPQEAAQRSFSPLNVVVLQRQPVATAAADEAILGLPDAAFASFEDRPGLMTKREVRLLVLGELSLQPGQVIWDIGAGTGSVSVEIGRLVPDARVYAVEKTAMGAALVEQNRQQFNLSNIVAIHGSAPAAIADLPSPNRVFIGGSGGQLHDILAVCDRKMQPGSRIVLALATLEHLNQVMQWVQADSETPSRWQAQYLQVQLSRAVGIAALTRWQPLNPVTLVTLKRH